ncbi:4-galactosyl-N-acetylglucosaminide 3-alpha-L-fucosyltransferase FUT6 [Ciona intestinalis]
MKLRFIFRLIIVLCVASTICYIWLTIKPSSLEKTIPDQISYTKSRVEQFSSDFTKEGNDNRTLILYWGLPWGDKSSGPPEGSPMGDCIQTYDRNKITQAKAVVFHYTVIAKNEIPWRHYRDPNQLYVWWSAEGPGILQMEGRDLREFDGGFFNWTWTYRQNADVFRGYGYRGYILDFVPKGKQVVDEILKHKTKTAFWAVSKCEGMPGAVARMKYFKEIVASGIINITTQGRCFPGSESIPKSFPMIYPTSIKEHKFYFAFENAIHCRDYITEKFWDNALRNDMVPVVWGPTKDDVLSVAPLDSFIHTDDFDSPAKLAEYLQFLDKNDDEYRKYFRWREDGTMTDEKMVRMTQEKYPDLHIQRPPKSLCEKLTSNKETKIIPSLTEIFMNSDREGCLA